MDNNEIMEARAIEKVKHMTDGDLYILLSSVEADMIRGLSFPYVGEFDQGKVLYVFDNYDFARAFVAEQGHEIVDGVYPIAKFSKTEEYNTFETICSIAYNLGIMYIDFNPGRPVNEALGVTIPWLRDKFGFDLTNITLILSPKQKAELDAQGPDAKPPVAFNPMPIYKFTDPYAVMPDRRAVLAKIPVDYAESVNSYVEAIRVLPLNELCFLSEVLKKDYSPKAEAEGNKEKIDLYISMYHILDQIITQMLSRLKLYTLLDNDEVMINQNKVAYLLYTDRFKYMGEYRYKETSLDGLCKILKAKDVDFIIVTNGPGQMHLTSVEAVENTLKKIK